MATNLAALRPSSLTFSTNSYWMSDSQRSLSLSVVPLVHRCYSVTDDPIDIDSQPNSEPTSSTASSSMTRSSKRPPTRSPPHIALCPCSTLCPWLTCPIDKVVPSPRWCCVELATPLPVSRLSFLHHCPGDDVVVSDTLGALNRACMPAYACKWPPRMRKLMPTMPQGPGVITSYGPRCRRDPAS